MASQYLTLYKMIILYMLDRSESQLTRANISDFMLGTGYTDYLTLQEAFGELLERGLLREKTMGNRTYPELTDAGQEALTFFRGEMNPAIQQQIDDYLKEHRMELRNEAGIRTNYERRPNGEYMVDVAALEQGDTILGLSICVPDEETAQRVTDHWQAEEMRSEIYRYLVEKLWG